MSLPKTGNKEKLQPLEGIGAFIVLLSAKLRLANSQRALAKCNSHSQSECLANDNFLTVDDVETRTEVVVVYAYTVDVVDNHGSITVYYDA